MGYHLRKGAFGKKEQHMERKLMDYLADIEKYASGMTINVRNFTMRNNGRIVDTDKISMVAARMVELDTEIKDKKEKEFYISYFYCALALMSLEFNYIPYDDPETDRHAHNFPKSLSFNSGMNLELMTRTIIFEEIGVLYNILSDNQLEFFCDDWWDNEDVKLSPEQERELHEDIAEDWSDFDIDEIMRNSAEAEAEYESWIPMSAEEAKECNRAEGARLKAYYPGYRDYVKYAEKLDKLFKEYYDPEAFSANVRKMTSEFLLAEGYCIYADEEKYLKVMVQLNRTRKLLIKYMEEMSR